MPETRSLVEIAGRPEKPVACPRCESWNTKFCYYNNHNVNQPRHYCKGCQRYWTEGGSLRNVPVGAGKRKIRLNQSPHAGPVEAVSNTPDIFCFTGSDLGHGVYNASTKSSFQVPTRQQVACSLGESKPLGRLAVATPGENNVHTSLYQVSPAQTQPYAISTHQTGLNYEASKLQTFAAPFHINQPIEKLGMSEPGKKEIPIPTVPSLDLNLSKKTGLFEKERVIPSSQYSNATHDVPLSHQNIAMPRVSHERHVELDESTCCSAVTTAAIRSAVTEASNTSSTRPVVDQSSGVVNVGGAAWGASMWPWIWPFIFNGSNVPPQVDANVVSAIGAMAAGSMPPVHPAVAAAIGAIASGHMPQMPQLPQIPQTPQVPPNLSAAFAASFLQMPQLWNPYAWGVPWPAAAWNMANVGANPSNGVCKRPRSTSPEQGSVLKTAKMDEAANSASANKDNGEQSLAAPLSFSDASLTKVDGFQTKHAVSEQPEEQSGSDQCQSPHSNPAAQVRSAAFQEGA